ncbi:MAG: hypothetical protein P3W87_006620 [Gammaproteobacteria bacterium]|nr:hypothetical protein [Gammaproteobacteria bacterium]
MKFNTLLKTLAITGSFTLLTACATGPEGGDSAAYETAIKEAKAALAEAQKVNNVWGKTEDYMKAAEKAASEGKYDEATKLAKRVKFEADMAVKQANEQKNAGPYKN